MRTKLTAGDKDRVDKESYLWGCEFCAGQVAYGELREVDAAGVLQRHVP